MPCCDHDHRADGARRTGARGSGHDHDHDHDHGLPADAAASPRWRRILWIALAVNAGMFALEVGAGLRSGSVSLLADAVDFFGDAANYALTLAVLGLGAAWRARAAWVKGATMGLFGLAVIGRAAWTASTGALPEPTTMGAVGMLALAANVGVAALLWTWREGDANMRSVWLCSRNDALGNVAVLAAALGVFGTGTAWPDLAVAAVMAVLALTAARSVMGQARRERRAVQASGPAAPGRSAPAGDPPAGHAH